MNQDQQNSMRAQLAALKQCLVTIVAVRDVEKDEDTHALLDEACDGVCEAMDHLTLALGDE